VGRYQPGITGGISRKDRLTIYHPRRYKLEDVFERASRGRMVPLAEMEDAVDVLSGFPFRACPECDGNGESMDLIVGSQLLGISLRVCPLCCGSGLQPYLSLN